MNQQHFDNDLMNIPDDLRQYAKRTLSTDPLDHHHGLDHIVVLTCRGCHEGWAWHWAGVERSFRAHLSACPAIRRNLPPPVSSLGGLHHVGK